MIDVIISKFANSSRARHIAKTITWRIVGTVDTFMLAWWLSGDPLTGMKIGGAEVVTKMILYYFHERTWYKIDFGLRARRMKKHLANSANNTIPGSRVNSAEHFSDFGPRVNSAEQNLYRGEQPKDGPLDTIPSESLEGQDSTPNPNNIIQQAYSINHEERKKRFGQGGKVLWFTGLSGSGKSTIANLVDQKLHELGYRSYVLDGDNIRLGLNKGLTFSDEDRKENIRRIAEVAKLFSDANMFVLTAFISPFREDRIQAKEIIGEDNFIEVFIDTPLEECERRDVKGLYKKARNGEIKNFTGIGSAYEAPDQPTIHIKTTEEDIQASVEKVIEVLSPKT